MFLAPNINHSFTGREGIVTMKFGFVSLPASGHLNPMTALARRMQARGHEVVFIGVPETEAAIRAANLRFVPFCEREYPLGSVAKLLGGVAKLSGVGCRAAFVPRNDTRTA